MHGDPPVSVGYVPGTEVVGCSLSESLCGIRKYWQTEFNVSIPLFARVSKYARPGLHSLIGM